MKYSKSKHDQSLLSLTQEVSADEVKFDLYIKAREIKQINEYLERIMLFSKKRKQAWLGENEEMINQLLDSIMEDSMMVMDGLEVDSESMELSVELMINLRNAVYTLRNLIYSKQRIKH
ncbi:MAG: hypothetical protein PVJ09_04035 [Candidatus Woesebacteria bacterium]|jgi:hypothetical protein